MSTLTATELSGMRSHDAWHLMPTQRERVAGAVSKILSGGQHDLLALLSQSVSAGPAVLESNGTRILFGLDGYRELSSSTESNAVLLVTPRPWSTVVLGQPECFPGARLMLDGAAWLTRNENVWPDPVDVLWIPKTASQPQPVMIARRGYDQVARADSLAGELDTLFRSQGLAHEGDALTQPRWVLEDGSALTLEQVEDSAFFTMQPYSSIVDEAIATWLSESRPHARGRPLSLAAALWHDALREENTTESLWRTEGDPAPGIGPQRLIDGWAIGVSAVAGYLLDITNRTHYQLGLNDVPGWQRLVQRGEADSVDPRLLHLLEPSTQKSDSDTVLARGLLETDKHAGVHFEDELFKNATRMVADAQSSRRYLGYNLGQCTVLPSVAVQRASFVPKQFKHILCVGDDDLTSIALAALGHEVTVWDVDTYTLELIMRCAQAHNLPIRTERYDLRDPVPNNLVGVHDGFVTDPMSNFECLSLFLNRGIAASKPAAPGFCALFPPAEAEWERTKAALGLREHERFLRQGRYATAFATRHDYESDWIALDTSQATLTLTPTTTSIETDLYREAMHRPSHAAWTIGFGGSEESLSMEQLEDMIVASAMKAGVKLARLKAQSFNHAHWVVASARELECTANYRRDTGTLFVSMTPLHAEWSTELRAMVMGIWGDVQVRLTNRAGLTDFSIKRK